MTSLRLAMHVHSSWSYDATWSLSAIASAFRKRRYDAVFLCEHDRSMSAVRLAEFRAQCVKESKGIVLVPGVEYSDPDNVVHLPTWGEVPFLGADRPSDEILQEVQTHGGVSLLAHPSRNNAWARLDETWVPLLSGIEVWSRKYDGWRPNEQALEFATLHDLTPVASLDFHRRRQFAPLVMRVLGDAGIPTGRTPTEAELVACLAHGFVSPFAAGRSLQAWTSGPSAKALRGLDRLRRRVVPAVKRISP